MNERVHKTKKYKKLIETNNIVEQLRKELQALEQDQALKRTMEFKEHLDRLLDEYGFAPKDLLVLWGLK